MRAAAANSCFIYFFGEPDGAVIKLGRAGTAAEVAKRKASHEGYGPRQAELVTLAVLRTASLADESSLKEHWKHYRVNGKEWIRLPLEGRQYIAWVRKLPFVSVRDSVREWEGLPIVDYEQWRPGSNRVGHVQQQGSLLPSPEVAALGPWGDVAVDDEIEGDYFSDPRVPASIKRVSGRIDTDPASCKAANVVVGARTYYGVREDGTRLPWRGVVYLNPPFDQWKEWTEAALREWARGEVTEMYIYVSGTGLFSKTLAPLVAAASAVLIPSMRFDSHGPKATGNNTYANPILYFGERVDSFAAEFSQYGTVKR